MKIGKIALKLPKRSARESKENGSATTKMVMIGGNREKVLATLCYLGILALIPVFWGIKSLQLKSHISSGIVVLALWVLLLFVFQIPLVGIVLGTLLLLSIIVFSIWGIYDAIKGAEAKIPGVEKVAVYFN